MTETPQDRHDRLQDAWVALSQLHAHYNQEGYQIDRDEKIQEGLNAISDVIGYYQDQDMVEQ